MKTPREDPDPSGAWVTGSPRISCYLFTQSTYVIVLAERGIVFQPQQRPYNQRLPSSTFRKKEH